MLRRLRAQGWGPFILALAGLTTTVASSGQLKDPGAGPSVDFPLGTATPSEVCGECHGALYFEHAFGFGADLKWKPIVYKSLDELLLSMPSNFADTGTAHHLAGVDP